MEEWLKFIGALIVAMFFVAIPVLATLSVVLNWYDGLKFIFCSVTAVEVLSLIGAIMTLSDELRCVCKYNKERSEE